MKVDATGYQRRVFVHQLRLIRIGNERVVRAIRDYYRAFVQRSRWVREELIGVGDLERYEDRLKDAWEGHFLWMRDELGEAAAEEEQRRYAGQLYKWVETEPFVFRALEGQRQLAFREDSQGRVTHMFADKIPTVAFARLAWYETEPFQVALLSICAALLLSALMCWAIGAFINRRAGISRAQGSHPASRARLLAAVVGGLDVLSLGMLLFTLSRSQANVATNVPLLLLPVMIVELIAAVLTLGVIAFAVVAWTGKGDPEGRPYWSVWGRVHYTLVALAALVYMVWLYCWNLLGFQF